MRPLLAALLAGALVLAGCPSSDGEPAPDGAGGDGGTDGGGADGGGGGGHGGAVYKPSAKLSVVDPSGATGPFALDALERLVVHVDCSHLSPGAHEVRVAVTSPGGSLHAQLPSTLRIDGKRQGRASSSLQVRGTTIESYRQLGTWQFVASVDGVPMATTAVDIVR